jgi:type I restriction enzyme, S subunit
MMNQRGQLIQRIRKKKSEFSTNSGKSRWVHSNTAEATDAPYALPEGWAWAQWEEVALRIGDIDHKMPDAVEEGVPYVSPRDFLPGNRIDFDGAKRISIDDFNRLSTKIKPEVGDLIYPRYGTIGECRLVTVSCDFLVSYSCAVIKTVQNLLDPRYQYFFSISKLCRSQAKEAENKTAQANVGIKSIKEFLFPLPPLAEQRRIVGRVDQLMALVDQLETQLTASRATAAKLTEAVVAELTAQK